MASEEIHLEAVKREHIGKGPSRRLRNQGRVPVVVYGHGKAAVSLHVDVLQLAPHIHHTGLLKLAIDGRKREVSAVIKDVQFDAIRGDIKHVDFQEVRANEVITATIPVIGHGEAAGESAGGILDQILHEVEMRCAVNKMPEHIEVDVTPLEVGHTVCLADLSIPDGAVLEGDPDQIVFSVVLPQMEVEEPEEAEEGALEELAEEGGEEPEVISKGKQEEDEAAEAK